MTSNIFFRVNQKDFNIDHITYYDPLSVHFSLHTHDIFELLYIKSGHISYITEGKTYPLHKNCLVFIRPACIHQILAEDNEPYHRYDILYDIQNLHPDLYLSLPSDLDVISFDGNSFVNDLFLKMDHYHKLFPEEIFCRMAKLLLEELLYNILITSTHQPEQQVVANNPLVLQAVKYIEAHISELTGIDEICHALYISKSHLHHLFTRYLHITPKKYILSKRLTLAQIAIRAGHKPTEIYGKYGFHNYATFYRAYLNHFGCRPSDEPSQFTKPQIHS